MEYSPTYKKLAKDALEIYNNGAVNPIPLVRIVSELMVESKAIGGANIKAPVYAPVRLILAQLAYLMGTGIGSYELVEKDIAFVESLG
jgi:hypothetical protein